VPLSETPTPANLHKGDCESVRLDSSTAPAIHPARALIERALSLFDAMGATGWVAEARAAL